MQALYPIRAVVQMTGLSLDTLRAWERRHQAVVPKRSPRGREYSTANVERLMLLSDLVRKGHRIGSIAPLSDRELTNLCVHRPVSRNVEPPPDLLRKFLSAIESLDSARASDDLNLLAAVLPSRDFVYQVAVPLMQEVGRRWHQGTLAIAQEHMVSQMLRSLMGSLARLHRPENGAWKILLATPSGELHELGLLAAGMLAAMSGLEPVYLGPNLPALEIAGAAKTISAQVVLLGITYVTESTSEHVNAIAAAMPKTSRLWLGGANADRLDLSGLRRKAVVLKDLSALERECRRRK
jgi:MerR family transcriptional regulator, light-induced transcriptional regulator